METVAAVIKKLKQKADPTKRSGMKHFGINVESAFCVSIPTLRSLAKEIGINHSLALELWKSGVHEARILAGMIDDKALVTEEQMEAWVSNFNSWDLCDQVCSNLFDKTKFAYSKSYEWIERKEEFVKRAGFALMACLAVHDKKASDSLLLKFFPEIEKGAVDERNFVKKAVNWALRQIGKRNKNLNEKAIIVAERLGDKKDSSSRWVGKNALRELKSIAVQKRLRN
jgi:3-methyladenine DNA glycosylase AlkD